METSNIQISAQISRETKLLVERYVKAHGTKKAFLIESALRHHLLALQELPVDVIIPPRLVVSQPSGEVLLNRIDHPQPPTEDLKSLLKYD